MRNFSNATSHNGTAIRRSAARAARGRPRREILYGLDEIGDFFGVERTTVKRWIIKNGLPAAQMPDGTWAITVSLIDKWLLSRHVSQAATQNARKRLREARNEAIDRSAVSQAQDEYY